MVVRIQIVSAVVKDRDRDGDRKEPRIMGKRVVRIEDGAFNWSALLGITGAFAASVAMWIGVVHAVAVAVRH